MAQTVVQELTNEDVQNFAASLRGELIRPGDAAYDAARKLYNGMIDKRPAFIARCADVADVISAVNFGREHHLTVAVRGGGHSGPGLGSCNDGLVIDLSRLKGMRVDPATDTVRVEGGCTWGEVDHATHAFGRAVPAGIISTTGVGGLTLGGGHGYLARQYGLTIDHLLAADVVLADGSLVTASEQKHADLFWALRGGGGNFGVVTSFLFKTRPVDMVYGGPMLWPIEQAKAVMQTFQDFLATAPETVSGFFAFLIVPPGPPFPENLHLKSMCGIVWCCSGPAEQAEATLQTIKAKMPPAFAFTGSMPYPAIQSMFDPLYPPGMQWYWKGDFFKTLGEEALDECVKHGSQLPTMLSSMHLYPIDGAVQRVGVQETAFNYRDARYSMVIVGVDPDPANKEKITTWARDYWSALHPYSAGGAYVNFMMEERVQATYGDNYPRLVAIKNKYDPGNLFHVNQNIKPTV